MLSRRKVETRRQHEKRMRRKQQVAAINTVCGDPQQQQQQQHDHHRRHLPRQPRHEQRMPLSPLSDYSREGDEVLEIYESVRSPSTKHKRRRPQGRVQLYRQFAVDLSSSSSSSCTESAHSQSFSNDGTMSNDYDDSMPSPQQAASESVGELEAGQPVDMTIVGIEKEDTAATISVKNIQQKSTETKAKIVEFTEDSSSSRGSKSGASYLCCVFPAPVVGKPIRKKGPGMSLTEEKRLWRAALEGDLGANYKPAVIAIGEDQQVDQIEVVPVDKTFQTTGAVNYAEMEGIGMVFAPSAPGRATKSPSSAAAIPWWKRDSWTDSSHRETGPDAQDASHARTSACTKKVANRRCRLPRQVSRDDRLSGTEGSGAHVQDIHKDIFRLERNPVASRRIDHANHEWTRSEPFDADDPPRRQSDSPKRRDNQAETHLEEDFDEISSRPSPEVGPFVDISVSDLDESLDHRIERIARERILRAGPRHEAFQLVNSGKHRPYQVFEAKPGRRKGLVIDCREENGMSEPELSLAIDIPFLNQSYPALSLESKADLPVRPVNNRMPVHVETVQGESGSEINSESDLSELVRRRDASQPAEMLRSPDRSPDRSPIGLQKNGARGACCDAEDDLGGQPSSPLFAALFHVETGEVEKPRNAPKNVDARIQEEAYIRQPCVLGPLHDYHKQARSPRSECPSISPVVLRGRPPYFNDPAKQTAVSESFGTRMDCRDIPAPFAEATARFRASLSPRTVQTDQTARAARGKTTSPIRLIEDSPSYAQKNSPSPGTQVLPNTESRQSRWRNHRRFYSRGRSGTGQGSCKHIDLTNHSTTNLPIRKRSLSPIRLYGDPPIPRRMDGSPVRSTRSPGRANSRPSLLRLEDDTRDSEDYGVSDPAQERDGMFTEFRELALNQANICDLIAALSPNNDPTAANLAFSKAHTVPDGSGVLMFKPTINIYNGQPETANTAYQAREKTVDRANEIFEEEQGAYLALRHNDKQRQDPSIWIKPTSYHQQNPAFHTQTAESDRENVYAVDLYGAPFPNAMWAPPEIAVPLDDDDSSIDDELRQLAASEKLLRKELEEVQQRSAERRLRVSCPDSCEGEGTTVYSTRGNARNFNERYGGNKTADAVEPASENAIAGESSSVIDLSCVEDVTSEKTMILASALPVAHAFQGDDANRRACDLVRDQTSSSAHFLVGEFVDDVEQFYRNDGDRNDEIEVVFVEDGQSFENPLLFVDNEPRTTHLGNSMAIRISDSKPYLRSNRSSCSARSPFLDTMGVHTETEAPSQLIWSPRTPKHSASSHEHSNTLEVLSVTEGNSNSDAFRGRLNDDGKCRLVYSKPCQEREVDLSLDVGGTPFAFRQPAWSPARGSDGLYLPYFAKKQRSSYVSQSIDNSTADAKCSGIDLKLPTDASVIGTNGVDREVSAGGDVLVDRELSWRAVEQLYHLPPRDVSDAKGLGTSHDVDDRKPLHRKYGMYCSDYSEDFAGFGRKRDMISDINCSSPLGPMDRRRLDSATERHLGILQFGHAEQNGTVRIDSPRPAHHFEHDYCRSPKGVTFADSNGSSGIDAHHVSYHTIASPSSKLQRRELDTTLKMEVGVVQTFSGACLPAAYESESEVFEHAVTLSTNGGGVQPTPNNFAAHSARTAYPVVGTVSGISAADLQLQHNKEMENLTRNQNDDRNASQNDSISSTSVLDIIDIDSADRSLCSMLLRYDQHNNPNGEALCKPRPPQDPETSRCLQSLLLRHGHQFAREISHDAVNAEVNPNKDENSRGFDNEKAHGIYAELVRRGRPTRRYGIGKGTALSSRPKFDTEYRQQEIDIDLATKVFLDDSQKTIFNWHPGGLIEARKDTEAVESKSGDGLGDGSNSQARRLERLRKLQAKMQPVVNERARRRTKLESDKQPPQLLRKMTGARQRASKSLRGHVAVECNFAQINAQQGHHEATRLVNEKANAGGLVEVLMHVTGTQKGEQRKKKKDADFTSREHSIASSTKSKDLVHALPASAKTRNVAAAKPGSLLWEATAGRELS